MRNRITLALVAILAAIGIVLSANAASALTGNAVRNSVQPSNYAIGISDTNPYSFDYNIWPYQVSANNVSCFKPALTSHSYWGGIYWGGVVRCFAGSGNGTLTLYSGLP